MAFAYLSSAVVGLLIFPTRQAMIASSRLPSAVQSSESTSLSVRSFTNTLFMLAGMTPTVTRSFCFRFLVKVPIPPLHGSPAGNSKVGPDTDSFVCFSLVFCSFFFCALHTFLASATAFWYPAECPFTLSIDFETELRFFLHSSVILLTSSPCFLTFLACHFLAFSFLAFSFLAFSFLAFSFLAFSLAAFSLADCSFAFFSLLATSLSFFSLKALSFALCSLPFFSFLADSLAARSFAARSALEALSFLLRPFAH